MKQVGPKLNPVPMNVKGVQGTGASTAAGSAPKKVTSQAEKVTSPVVSQPATSSVNGIQTVSKPDGSVTKKATSGLEVDISADGQKTVRLPGEKSALKLNGDKAVFDGDGPKDVSVAKSSEGTTLVSYSDKAGNLIEVEPDTLFMSATKPYGNGGVSQIFSPDGNQEVVAFGNEKKANGKTTAFEKRAVFNPAGEMIANKGFSTFEAEPGKIKFDLGNTTVTRPLARALPGQAEVPSEPSSRPATTAASNSAPVALLAEDPGLAALTAGGGKSTEAAAPQAQTTTEKAAPKIESPFPDLPKAGPNFFSEESASDTVRIDKTPSGVTVRSEANTRSFSLPTGDQFRTDGNQIEVLGDKPRAKNARIVVEDNKQLLAYSDKAGNSYQLDVNTGDLAMSNRQGSLTQKLNADGSKEFGARGTYTTEAGTKKSYFHQAKFGADGGLEKKEGFDDLAIGEKSMTFTLPNGQETSRTLIEPSTQKYSEKKAGGADSGAKGAADSWAGDTQSMVDSILGKIGARPVGSTGNTNPANETQGANQTGETPFAKPTFSPSGVSRTELPDGSVMTRLPNGMTFTDGEKPFATDTNGEKLEVLKRPVPTEAGYILYAKSKDGAGFTIAPDHLDFLTESKDGKVHQLVGQNGKILTSIKDGKNQHLHELDTQKMWQTASPGVRSDATTPNMLYVDGPENKSYELPHPFPDPQSQVQSGPYGQAGPNHVRAGVKPSFWEKTKAFFTGEDIPQSGPAYGAPNGTDPAGGHHGAPPYLGGMPGSQMQYDPIMDQMHQMNKMNRTLTTLNLVGMGASMLMPMMFFPVF